MNKRRSFTSCLLHLFILGCLHLKLIAQDSPQVISPFERDSVLIMASRLGDRSSELSVIGSFQDLKSQLRSASLLSVNEFIESVPGLFVSNALNQTQDSRISIRGFGSRSAFGIRGIKVLVDGVPETTPDGQTQLDNLIISSLSAVQIVNAGQSALYGNASGGILAFSTERKFNNSFAEFNSRVGSHAYSSLSAGAGFRAKDIYFRFNINQTDFSGYRQWSRYKTRSFSVKTDGPISTNTQIGIQLSFTESPEAQDPGGVSLKDFENDNKSANARNIEYKAGEQIRHFKTAGHLTHSLNKKTKFELLTYYSFRDFMGQLPFEDSGLVELERDYGGLSVHLDNVQTSKKGIHKIRLGSDMALQDDQRRRFNNIKGKGGEQRLDQLESFDNYAFFFSDRFQTTDWIFNASLRYDINILALNDRFLTNGDQSDRINMSRLSYSIGGIYKLSSNWQIRSNYSDAFETPALSELSSALDGGFNKNLKAQTARTLELGLRSLGASNPQIALTLYRINSSNEILAYELTDQPGRIGYRNAGNTIRMGLEGDIKYTGNNGLNFSTGFYISRMRFADYILQNENLEGNRIPGIPEFALHTQLNYEADKWWMRITNHLTGSLYANDQNTVRVDKFSLLHIKTGVRFRINSGTLENFIGADNILHAKYFDNIRINAFGGRYYESGTGVFLYGGLRFNWED